MASVVDFADFRAVSRSEVGARNGLERVECDPERPIRVAGEVAGVCSNSHEYAGTGAIRQEKTPTENGWGFIIGGDGGNRTRVRKSSTGSSTYLAVLFVLT